MNNTPSFPHLVGGKLLQRSQVIPPVRVLIMLLMLAAIWTLWPNVARASIQSGHAPNPNCVNVINTSGGSCVSGPVQLTPQEQAILAKKNTLAQEYALARAGKLSLITFQHDYQAFLQQYGSPEIQQHSTSPASCHVSANGSGVGGGFSVSTFTYDLTTDIDNGWPLAGNIVEYANNGPRLIGHPQSATIYHWIAIRGYTNYGTNTYYADSISGDSWIWPWAVNVPPYSTISSSDMTTLLNGRGYIW